MMGGSVVHGDDADMGVHGGEGPAPRTAGPAADGGTGVAPAATPPVMNVANYLTVLRLALVPVFLLFFVPGDGTSTGWRVAAWVAFAVASITDSIDGDLARSRGLVTDFGKIADPIADKALTGAAFLVLSALGELPWWITIVVLSREIGVTFLRFWVIRRGVIAASRGGKVKTLLQSCALGLYVLPLPHAFQPWLFALMLVAVVVTVATGIDYVMRAIRLRRAPRRIPQ
jgi:CDP-diacylglycerol--glycerol-3-phosphate 3-phosphatidyltransferase